MRVTLTLAELRYAAFAGVDRRLSAIHADRTDRYGTPAHDLWGEDIEAAAAELAVAKAFGAYWVPVARDPLARDVGKLQVRATWRPDGCLIVYEADADRDPFILVTGTAPTFDLRGWAWGGEAKVDQHWKPDAKHPAFFMPQDALRPMETHDVPPPFDPPEGLARELWDRARAAGVV